MAGAASPGGGSEGIPSGMRYRLRELERERELELAAAGEESSAQRVAEHGQIEGESIGTPGRGEN